jgi:DNA mismatch repair protein MSH4
MYTQLQNDKSMMMLYQITPGALEEAHYGLTLARLVPLPPGVVEHAAQVAQKLKAHMLKRNKVSETVLREKRRKLILNLREHLVQARNGILEGEVLTAWLKELQKEFIHCMTALEAEASSAGQESNDEYNDEVMREPSFVGEQRPGTQASQPSVMSSTTTDSDSTFLAMPQASANRAVSDSDY